jgi:hypothetical protein
VRLKLTRAQLATIAVCLTPLYALIAVDAYVHHQAPPTRGTGYVLTHDVTAGVALARDDIAPFPLTYSPSDFNYLSSAPTNGIVARPMHAGTLLTSDDVLPPNSTVAEVTIQATNPPPLTAGSLVDIYVATGSDYRRVGAHVPVTSSNPLTIQVPARETAAWLALSNSHLTMLVSRTSDTASSGTSITDACAALAQLSGTPCQAAGLGTVSSASTAQP